MKKRLLSLALTALMLLSLLPAAAFAEEDPGGTPWGNLCRPSDGATVTATASSWEADSVRPANAIDGDSTSNSSRWGSAVGNGPNWLQINLGKTRQVGVVRIFWERLNVLSYRLEGSTDGTTWITLHDSPNLITQVNETLTFPSPVNIQYLRVYISSHQSTGLKGDGTESVNWNTVSLFEVEAYRDEDSIPVDPRTVLNGLTAERKDGKLVFTTQAQTGNQEFTCSFAANLEQVVGADGTIYTPLVNTQVELDVTVTREFDGVTAATSPSQPIRVIIPGEHTANEGNAKPQVIPELAEWYSSTTQRGKYYTLTASSKIVAPAELDGVARELKADIKDLFDLDLPIASSGAADGDIVLVLDESKADEGFDNETYLMEVTDRVTITATAPTGAYWGTRSALQALKLSGDAKTIPQGTARDYPEFRLRGFVLDVGRKPVSMEKLQEIVKNMAWYKLNDFHVHLNDNLIFLEEYIPDWQSDQPTTAENYAKANNAYSAFRLESDIEPETGGNQLTAKDYAYTKDGFKTFIADSAALGVNIVPEIDAPAHAKSITDAFPSLRLFNASGMYRHPYNDHLDLSETNYSRSLGVVQDIFDDYIDDGTFGSIVHFGADEYYDNHAAYRRFFKDMVSYLKENGKTPRVWGSLSYMSGGTTNGQSYDIEANSADTEGVQMNIWNTGWANPQAMYNLGFNLINVTDWPCYMVPSGGGDRGGYGDYLNLTSIYDWTPNCIGGAWIPASSSQMLGGAFAIWNDNIDTEASGLDEVDLFDRFFDALPVISVKLWGEGDALDRTLSQLQTDAASTGAAPNTNPYHETDAPLPSYDFNGSDSLTLTNAEVAGGALTLKGGASYAETGLDRLGWGSTLSFRIKVASIAEEGVIFEGDPAYGEYAIKALPVAGKTDKWKLGFSRELYDYEFAAELPVGEWVTLTITTAKQSTKLSVDGGAEISAVGRFEAKPDSNTQFKGKIGITNSSFQLPVARIGSKTSSFVGQLDAVAINSPIEAEPESAESIRAYQIAEDQVRLSWNQVGTACYQVYAKAPGGDWTRISGDDAVNGNVFIHTGYTAGTVYRVLTPGSEVNSPINTDTSVVDIRASGDGYVLNTETDRISYSAGWSTRAEEGSYIGPSVQYCDSPTASLTAELVFIGNGIQLIGGMKDTMGRMTVEIDGVVVGEANYRSDSDSPQHKQIVFEKVGLDYGVHTIKLTGAANSGTVEIEAFRVLVPAESIQLSAPGLADNSLTIATDGPAATVTATVSPANGSGPFEWTSSDPDAAAVTAVDIRPDAQGRITAAITPVAGGSATITVADKSTPAVKAEISVTVTQPVTEVVLPESQRSVTLYLNPAAGQSSTVTLTPEVRPDTATNRAVTYSSSDTAVATVDQDGLVTGVKAGTAVINVTTVDGSYTASCTVTVTSGGNQIAPIDPIPSNPSTPTTPDTTTTVEKNDDGSTTTTVTDKETGTVTETTEKPDGSTEVVETKPDGTVTETTKNTDGSTEVVETKPDGTVTETTEKPDGSTEMVETKPDGTVTETNTDAEGGKVEKVTTPEKNVAITVTDAEGEVLAQVELPAEIPAPETRFEDVPEGHWADQAIHSMAAMEVVKGVGDDRFDMDGDMTRGALATVLSRLSNGQEGLESSFADVPSDEWYADGIAWAAKTGIVTGYSETEFGPEDTITREQLAVMLCRYARLLGMDTTADSAELDSFNDGSSVHGWAADSIAWCVANGILRGMGNETLAPTATATRAQVAVMLQRFMDLMK